MLLPLGPEEPLPLLLPLVLLPEALLPEEPLVELDEGEACRLDLPASLSASRRASLTLQTEGICFRSCNWKICMHVTCCMHAEQAVSACIHVIVCMLKQRKHDRRFPSGASDTSNTQLKRYVVPQHRPHGKATRLHICRASVCRLSCMSL